MKFIETPLAGAYVIELDRNDDERGFFARSFCRREFEAHGLNVEVAQCNISYNERRGTLRGIHYQIRPHAEAKTIRCTSGAMFDVLLDLRPKSPTSKQWFGIELSAANYKMVYIPEGVAHGFQTLADRTEVLYQISEFYSPEAARGIRWNDPAFGIKWPLPVAEISAKDSAYQDFREY